MTKYQAPADLLKGRIILVTGAGDGIGAIVAETYAAHGATVVLLGRTQKKLELTYDQIVQAKNPQPAIIALDLLKATEHQYQLLAAKLQETFGRLDGLLHNAAIMGTLTPIEHYNDKLWQQVFQVNCHAPFLLTKACLPLLKKSDDASLIFSTANVAHRGQAYWGAYATSKAAQENLAQILAEELEVNTSIRVNCIDPGPVRTRMHALAYPGKDPKEAASPKDITGVYLYLMGRDSTGITGERFPA